MLIAKAVAGREKYRAFIRVAARHGLVDQATARTRLSATTLDPSVRQRVEQSLAAGFAAAGR